jgi:hypothetical protein
MEWIKLSDQPPTKRDCDKNDPTGFSVPIIVSDGVGVWDDVTCEIRRKFTFGDELKLYFWVHRFGYDNDSYELKNITHWMPLPEPPEQ